ncbi:hypothetical protein YB2330_002002 [Saitoella coloradoensis]
MVSLTTILTFLASTALISTAAPTEPQGLTIELTKRGAAKFTDANGVVNLTSVSGSVANIAGKYAKIDNNGHKTFEDGAKQWMSGWDATSDSAYQASRKKSSYGYKKGKRATSSKKVTATESLTNYGNDGMWAGPITIGGKTFTIDFDTGSADLWVPSVNCTSTACSGKNLYTYTKTFKSVTPGFTANYGMGSVSCNKGTETVTVAGLKATTQTFGYCYSLDSGFGGNFAADGLMGMAYQSIAQSGGKPFFNTLISQNNMNGIFSFRLARASGGQASTLTLGAVPSGYSVTYTPVVSKDYWRVTQSAVYVNGIAAVASTQAAIDTGTTYVVAPSADAASFYAAIPGSTNLGYRGYPSYYAFPCDVSIPTVQFNYGGKNFTMNSADFNLGLLAAGSNMCVGTIVASDMFSNMWVVGDSFLKSVLTVYDFTNNRVGFSPAA